MNFIKDVADKNAKICKFPNTMEVIKWQSFSTFLFKNALCINKIKI